MTAPKKDDFELAWSPDSHCLALDGIRGIAILMVTLYRFCQFLEPELHPWISRLVKVSTVGARGVDLFFVLSGFLITGILLRSKEKPSYFRNFFARRALRIFPLYFVSLGFFLYLVPWMIGTSEFEKPHNLQLYLMTYSTNLYMSWVNEWCFGPMDHFWSLAVEEHFYLVWPFLVLLFCTKRLLRFCIGSIVAIVALRSVAAGIAGTEVSVDVLTPYRADALLMGAILAVILPNATIHHRLRRASWILLFPTAAVILVGGIYQKRWLELSNTLCPLLCCCFMTIVLLSPKQSVLTHIVHASPLRVLGKYSYGMYVIQLPLASLLPYHTVVGNVSHPLWSAVAYVIGMTAATLLLAIVTYHSIEVHFLRLKKRFSS
jgi:peptidoglycan/LPS O-acetylase OafA/YrhL